MIARNIGAVLLLGMCVASVGAQNARTVERALADLRDGYADDELFFFRGCPQDDPVGREIFEAVRDIQLPGFGLQSLAARLGAETYPDCNFEPLNSWFAQTFETLHRSGEAGAAAMFAMSLRNRSMDERLRAAMLRAAADWDSNQNGWVFADVAIFRSLPPEQRVDAAIAAFRVGVSRNWIGVATYRLSRDPELAPRYFAALVTATPSLSDGILTAVANALGTDIRDGRVDPTAPGLAELRTRLAARPGVLPIPTTGRN